VAGGFGNGDEGCSRRKDVQIMIMSVERGR
jgi:hypothetical protein